MPNASLTETVGANVRRIRQAHKLTLEAVATASGRRGLSWDSARVAHFEAGRVPARLDTLVPLALALADCIDEPLTLADLLASDQPIIINPLLAVGPRTLIDWVQAGPVSAPVQMIGNIGIVGRAGRQLSELEDELKLLGRKERAALTRALDGSGIADKRLAASVGLTPVELAKVSARLWGTSFSEERDRRSSLDANAQAKGRVSRELKSELLEVLKHGNG